MRISAAQVHSSPKVMAMLRRHRRGIGQTYAQNVATEYQDWANNPNLNSPAYLAAEAADAGIPVSELGTNQQNAVSTLDSYCALNAQNVSLFGTAPDTTNCNGAVPTAGALATVSAVNTPTLPSAPLIATQPGPAIAVNVTIQNLSRPGQSLQVGDTALVNVTGAPNSLVTNTATQNGKVLGTSSYGSTDSSGNFSIKATMAAGDVGTWSETWNVAGISAAPITFQVSAPPAPSNQTSSSNSTGSSSGSSSSSTGGGGGFEMPAFFTEVSFGGVENWVWIAGALAAVVVILPMFGGRR